MWFNNEFKSEIEKYFLSFAILATATNSCNNSSLKSKAKFSFENNLSSLA